MICICRNALTAFLGRPVLPLLAISLLTVSCGGATAPIAPSVLPAATLAAAPSAGSAPRWTLTGTVRDSDARFGLAGVTVQLVNRFEARTATTDESGRYRFDAVEQYGAGMVFTREGYRRVTIEQVIPVEDTTVDVALIRECDTRPLPVALSYSISGRNVIFTWPASDDALDYRLSVGMWEYVSPVFSKTTTETSHVWRDAPPGTYHARVQGRNDCGFGNAANELKVVVP